MLGKFSVENRVYDSPKDIEICFEYCQKVSKRCDVKSWGGGGGLKINVIMKLMS